MMLNIKRIHYLSLKIEPLIVEITQVSKQGIKVVRINKKY